MLRILAVIALSGLALGFRVRRRAGVATEIVHVPGRACNGRGAFRARVFYPHRGKDLPILSFAHGSRSLDSKDGDFVMEYKELLESIAQSGYFVIAFADCRDAFKGGDAELIDSIYWLRHRAGYPINYTAPATVAGHAGGGWAALAAASDSKETWGANIGLALTLHPGTFGVQAPTVPTVYWTGENDAQNGADTVKRLYDQCPSNVERAFAVFNKKDHEAPKTDSAVYVKWVVRWMDCKIRGREQACDTRGGMCRSDDFSACEAEL